MAQKSTPLMTQYRLIKSNYQEMLLFFQVGDFYELFFEDAQRAANFLGITLTKRGKEGGVDIPLCGVPVHTVKHYLAKLLKGGFSIALCDQLEAPKPGALVRRGVTQVLTPGIITDSAFLAETQPSYICALFADATAWSLVSAEVLAGQLYATTSLIHEQKLLETELARFSPEHLLLPQGTEHASLVTACKNQGYFVSTVARDAQCLSWLQAQFDATVYEHVRSGAQLQHSLELLYGYMRQYAESSLASFKTVHFYDPEDYLMLDHATQRNLELFATTYDGGTAHSLCGVLNATSTAGGTRMLKKRLVRPLMDLTKIEHRLDAVAFLKERYVLLCDIKVALKNAGDLERTVGRIALERASLQDYLHLLQALSALQELHTHFARVASLPVLLNRSMQAAGGFSELQIFLQSALHDERNEPSGHDWVIRRGFDQELDALRNLMLNSQQALLQFEQDEQRLTGIGSLKVRYNNLYGYYIEITQANVDAVPVHYIHKHSLVGKNRYTSQGLQHLEQRIVSAQADAKLKEQELYARVVTHVRGYVSRLRTAALQCAELDVYASSATVASLHNYVRPQFHEDSRDILIEAGRHPVIEQLVGNAYVSNSAMLDDAQGLWIITGPNMGGKSTFLRQVAHICIMAQCGMFVPATSARLPLLDRIFTRIGAADNVAAGKSTFLVEMEETADICRYATERSLVILDEVGRGTSTQDGIALAQAIIEYLHATVRARCLFATHYHELTHLAALHPGIACYHTASQQTDEGIVFLHMIIPGVSKKSFGIEVARLAHLPLSVIKRAQELVDMGSQ